MLIRSAEWNQFLVNVPYSISAAKVFKKTVYSHWTGGPDWWTGLVDRTGGPDWWTGLVD